MEVFDSVLKSYIIYIYIYVIRANILYKFNSYEKQNCLLVYVFFQVMLFVRLDCINLASNVSKRTSNETSSTHPDKTLDIKSLLAEDN